MTPAASRVTVRATYGDALVNLVPGDPTPIRGRGLSASPFLSARLGIQLPKFLFDEFSVCVSRRLACLELGDDLLRSTARTLRDLLSQPVPLPAAQFDHLSLAFFGFLRRHSARASFNWITNTSRGGLPIVAFGEHIYRAAFPSAGNCASVIFCNHARSASTSRALSSSRGPWS